jgi:hypothetical protein
MAATRESKLVSKRSSKLALAVHASALRSNVARTWPLAAVDARSRSEAAKARHPSTESSGLRLNELIWRSALLRRWHRERWSSGNRPKGTRRQARALSRSDRGLTAAPCPGWFLTRCSSPFAERIDAPCIVVEVFRDSLERRGTAVGPGSAGERSARCRLFAKAVRRF